MLAWRFDFSVSFRSVDLNGREDYEITNEAADLWWAPVPESQGDYPNMRAKLNDLLEDIEDQWMNGELPWCRDTLESLVEPYQDNSAIDPIIALQADQAWHYDDYKSDATAQVRPCEIGKMSTLDSDTDSDVAPCDCGALQTSTAAGSSAASRPVLPVTPPQTKHRTSGQLFDHLRDVDEHMGGSSNYKT